MNRTRNANRWLRQAVDQAARLDRHYLTSRYPDALPEPAIPAEVYTRQDGEEAVSIARSVCHAARDAIPRP